MSAGAGGSAGSGGGAGGPGLLEPGDVPDAGAVEPPAADAGGDDGGI
jgi:hypothetical protein